MEHYKNDLEISKTAKIICEDKTYSYNQILGKVQMISSILMKINTKTPVAVFVERSENLLMSLLSLIYVQKPYVPIDINYPLERINFILKDCCIDTIITQTKFKSTFSGRNIICIDDLNISEISVSQDYDTNNTAYILYTSGSTGKPKGVIINRNSLVNFIQGVSEVIDFSADKRIACLTEPTFDIFFLESIMALNKGLTVVLANKNQQINPKFMAELIYNKKVDIIQMTPSRMQMLVSFDKDLKCLQNVKEILIGGEPFPLKLLNILQNKTTAKIYNMYGPTETTIWSTISNLSNKEYIDIGKPIKHTGIHIVNENLELSNHGDIGEICISGEGLASGYLNNPELTNQKFIFLSQKNINVYCTGDYGRQLKDGCYECLGRKDNQVKIRGHRIELEEVEKTLYEYKYIEKAVVTIYNISDQDRMLAAFYQAENELNENEIRNYMLLKLPDYMVPSKYIRVNQFYYTSSGKVDRNALNNYLHSINCTCLNPISNNCSDVEMEVLKLLNLNNIELESDILTLGIDSISFVELIVAIESKFNFEFDDDKLMYSAFKNVNEIIKYIESKI